MTNPNDLRPTYNLCRTSIPRDYFVKMVIEGGTELVFTCKNEEAARVLSELTIHGIEIHAGEFAEFDKVPS